MINELWNSFIIFETTARQTFLGTVILVGCPIVIIGMLYIGLFGKQVPRDTCSCCGQKLPEYKDKKEEKK